MRPSPRWIAIGVIALALAGLVLVDRIVDDPVVVPAPISGSVPGVAMPVAYPAEALTSTWFCAGGTAVEDGFADHTVVIVNPTEQARPATVAVIPGTLNGDANADALAAATPLPSPVDVPARGRVAIHLADVVAAPYAAAVVEVTGGGVVVEHEVSGPGGRSAAACATTASPTWHFAAGTVTQSTGEVLALLNPFPDGAVVDLDFETTDGHRAPPEYQNLPVPAGRLVVVDVFAAVARHDQISVSISADAARVVADRIQNHTASPRGLSLALGAPQPALTWLFPEGQTGEGLTETYTVYNPGDDDAEVDIEFQLDDASLEVEPIPLSIPAGSYSQVVVNTEQRIPVGSAHSVTVRSVNGVPIVPERRITSTDPATRTGVAYTLGSPLVAPEWVLAAGAATDAIAEFVVILNPSADSIARVSVASLASGQKLDIQGLQDLEIPAASRISIDMGQHLNREQLVLLITATRGIVVERGLYAAEGPGLSLSLGVPLAGGVTAAGS